MLACVPTIGLSPWLGELVDGLTADPAVGEVRCYVNEADAMPTVTHAAAHGAAVIWNDGTIYQAWNRALRDGRERGEPVALLNDDVRIPDGGVGLVAGLIAAHPDVAVAGFDHVGDVADGAVADVVRGTVKHGGVPGFAMIVRPWLVDDVNEELEWSLGDDDLVASAVGRIVRVGVPVTHLWGASRRHRPWVRNARKRDRRRWAQWGRTR